MTELKPCPFCGGKAEIKTIYNIELICCQGCDAGMIGGDKPIEMLIEMWNRRTENENNK